MTNNNLDLNTSFKKYCKDRNRDLMKLFAKHRNKITTGLNIASAFESFAETKSYSSLVKGGFSIIKSIYIDNNYNTEDFFSLSNGWKNVDVVLNMLPSNIFVPIIKSYPFIDLNVQSSSYYGSGKIYLLPIGEVGLVERSGGDYKIYFSYDKYTVENLIDFLVAEKLKDFDGKLISYRVEVSAFGSRKINLFSEKFRSLSSIKADQYTSFIKSCVDKNICRAILFYGPPGTGKTTLSQTVADNLGFKTLKINFMDFDPIKVRFFIENFKFETILIDDIDHVKEGHPMLDFLENIRKSVKVVLATANTLADFHPAVIRPGRFDQIIKVDQLEVETVRQILGPMTEKYFERVKHYPVCYINEFLIRTQIYPNVDAEVHLEELDARVKNQLAKSKSE